MINISFLREKGSLISCRISGHADYDEYRKDIVCSAVSAVSTAILNGIIEVLNIEVPYKVEDGFLSFDLKSLEPEDIDRCSVLMETMLLGFESIEVNYSEYIKVTIEEVY